VTHGGLQIGGSSKRPRAPAAAIEKASQVQMGFAERIIEDERLAIGGDRLVAPASILEDDAKIEPGQRRSFGGQSLAVVPLGGRQVAQLMKEAAQVVVRVGEAGTSGEGVAIGSHGAGWIAILKLEASG
jgi:hypothetical protein